MRNILIHFAIKYNGDYIKILSAIKDKEIVTIIYGKDVTPEELEAVENHIAENYDNLEYESIEGGQDVYSFILAIE